MAQLSALTSEHEEFQLIITSVWAFASKHGLNSMERDDKNNRKMSSFAEAQMAFDNIVMNALGDRPLLALADVNAELEQFIKKTPKPTRPKLGNFVITTLIRAAFWQKRTGELCWMFGLDVTDPKLNTQLTQYHAKVVDNLAKDSSRVKDV